MNSMINDISFSIKSNKMFYLLIVIFIFNFKVTSFALQSNKTHPDLAGAAILSMHTIWDGGISIWASDNVVRKYYPDFMTTVQSYSIFDELQNIVSSLNEPFRYFALSPSKQIVVGCTYQSLLITVICCKINFRLGQKKCFQDINLNHSPTKRIGIGFLANQSQIIVSYGNVIAQFDSLTGVKTNYQTISAGLYPTQFIQTTTQILGITSTQSLISISVQTGLANITTKYTSNFAGSFRVFYDSPNNYIIICNPSNGQIKIIQNVNYLNVVNTWNLGFNSTYQPSLYAQNGYIYVAVDSTLLLMNMTNGNILDSINLTFVPPIQMIQGIVSNPLFLPYIYSRTTNYIEIYGNDSTTTNSTATTNSTTNNSSTTNTNSTTNSNTTSTTVKNNSSVPKTPGAILCIDRTENCIECDMVFSGYCKKCIDDNMMVVNGICQSVQFKQLVSKTSAVVSIAFSMPNLRIFFKPLNFIFTNLEDYWFYIYHIRNYSLSLTMVFDSIKFINNQKIIPQFLRVEQLQKMMSVNKWYGDQPYLNNTPLTYYAQEEMDITFATDTNQMYTLNYFSAFITVLITRLLYFLLNRLKFCKKYAMIMDFLRQSGLYKQILVAFLQANLIFISFHCFMQLRNPSYFSLSTKINMIVTYCFLFAAIIYGLSFYFLVHSLCPKKDRGVFLLLKKNKFSGFLCETFTTGFKCLFNGFCHGYLLNSYILQILLLNLCKIFLVIIIYKLLSCYEKKIFGWFMVIYYCAGIVLDIALLIQYLINDSNFPLIIIEGIFLLIMSIVAGFSFIISIVFSCIESVKNLINNKVQPEKRVAVEKKKDDKQAKIEKIDQKVLNTKQVIQDDRKDLIGEVQTKSIQKHIVGKKQTKSTQKPIVNLKGEKKIKMAPKQKSDSLKIEFKGRYLQSKDQNKLQ